MNRFFILSDIVIAIRSKHYASTLMHRLDIEKTAHIPAALDALVHPAENFSFSKFRGDFYRYSHGENIKNVELVRRVEEAVPGTARIIDHPIWDLLSMPDINCEDLKHLAQRIEPGLLNYILKYCESSESLEFRASFKGPTRLRFGSDFLQKIDRRGLDELATLIILIKVHEMFGAYGLSRQLRELLLFFFIEMSKLPRFRSVVADLYIQTGQSLEVNFSHEQAGHYLYSTIDKQYETEAMLNLINENLTTYKDIPAPPVAYGDFLRIYRS